MKDMTLKKVAELAGVSHTTVSLVINNAEGSRVSRRTRERVLETIRKLDYNPNLTAKRLASGKTNSIGLFIPFEMPIFRNYTIIEMVAGIQDVLNEMGLDLVLFSGGRKLYRDRPINQIVRQKTVDGLIIFNTRYTTQHFVNNYIKNLNELKFNFVVLHYYWGKARINYVGVDYENDAYKAVSHLVSLGHKKVALIAGTSKAAVTSKIISGYKRALKDYQISPDDSIIAYADYDYQMAYEKTRMLIENNPSITSFFLGGYEMGPACLKAVKDSGLDIPEDISIICYVDNEIMPLLDPPITAIKWPYYDMGKKAAEILTKNGRERKRVIFETELMARDSTARVWHR
ncbi:MAG: LacI family DNA-binding transcriptional regulator [Desulfobacteraceae bacterium]|nr:MAG: LacI family DNA-binding transcriptional regulator [Desulfobacteraceae bacterium]